MINQIKSYEAFLKRIWDNELFKSNFIANPKAALAEIGVYISDTTKVEVLEDSLKVKNLVLPLESTSKKTQETNFAESEYGFKAVIQKAWQDEDFKARLLQNPKAAIKEIISTDFPDTLRICVYEDTPTIKHLVIPINTSNEEMNELDLMLVAGGIQDIGNIGQLDGFIARDPI